VSGRLWVVKAKYQVYSLLVEVTVAMIPVEVIGAASTYTLQAGKTVKQAGRAEVRLAI
jgi:hypothetical protein